MTQEEQMVDAGLEPSQTAEAKQIVIRGARVHNLKNIDVKLPRDKLVVITGLVGLGQVVAGL